MRAVCTRADRMAVVAWNADRMMAPFHLYTVACVGEHVDTAT